MLENKYDFHYTDGVTRFSCSSVAYLISKDGDGAEQR